MLKSLLMVVVCISIGISQEHQWQISLTTGETFSAKMLDRISFDSLILFTSNGLQSVNIDSISTIRFSHADKLLSGASDGFFVGTMVGAEVGMVGGAILSKPGGLIFDEPYLYRPAAAIVGSILGAFYGAILGPIVGGIIGAASSDKDEFDLSTLNHHQKQKTLNHLLELQNY